MKTKKIVVGAIAASMLSLSVCSLAPVASAAGDNVQISASKVSAEAGKTFEVSVSLSDIPSTGIAGVDVAVKYDNSILTVTSVEAGPITKTGAESKDPSVTSDTPVFDYEILQSEGMVDLMWATMLDSDSYWIKDGGVFCTIKGTVSSSAKDGDVSKIQFVPTSRSETSVSSDKNSEISIGYLDSANKSVSYTVKTSDGSVTVGNGTLQPTLLGDANCDKQVNIADAVLVMQVATNPDKYAVGKSEVSIKPQGEVNADVDGTKGLTNSDALLIQKFKLGLIDKF
jgi:hypothetical protein